MELNVHTDGGSRGNPGPAAIGVVIEKPDAGTNKSEMVMEFGKKIGETTNNVAEYTAVIEALKWLTEFCNSGNIVSTINFYLDSALVVNQINGTFKVKDANLRNILTNVRILEQGITSRIYYRQIPREQNSQADRQVNLALDGLI
jgi:ribonuclease HI